jgi:amidophosphoribosyltransferase
VGIVRAAGATEVHLRISCPPNAYPCYYGVDFPTRGELMAARHSRREIEAELNVDSLRYLSVEGMLDATSLPDDHFCAACFSGKYPLPTSDHMENKLRLEGQVVLLEEMAGG